MRSWLLGGFVLGALLFTISTPADSASSELSGAYFPRNNVAPSGPYAIDGTYMIGEKERALRRSASQIGPRLATRAAPTGMPATIGEKVTISISDLAMPSQYDEDFVVIMIGIHGIILVEKEAYEKYDPKNDEYVFQNPYGCFRTEDRISTSSLNYLLSEFDNVIYPTNTSVFGEPLARGEEGKKTWILIHNIRDDSYYYGPMGDDERCNPETVSYVAGYFSADEDAENNKNMMHIDSGDWDRRIGPDVDFPDMYETVCAHEFEHLIHFDQDPDESIWVDEGLANLAAFLCGYGHQAQFIAPYLVYHPITSLTSWDGLLQDYGATYLFALYLYEQFGGVPFISALVQESANGIEGIENTLRAFNHKETFPDIFDNWTVANYIDDTRKKGGKYGYKSLGMGTMDTWGYTTEYVLANFWLGPPAEAPLSVPSNWFFGLEPQPYTAHYFRFTNERKVDVFLDGDDFSGIMAHSGTYEWYSGTAAYAWRTFCRTINIPSDGATLNFWTYYEIEEHWDYGYVEVYDHNVKDWYTLPASGTIDYLPYFQDNPNTPNEREPSNYAASECWNAFTGNSGGWVPISMDLSRFSGHKIDLYFTTWQDSALSLKMMYIDDISIPEIDFFDDVEACNVGWVSTGWHVTDGIQENGFGFVAVDTRLVPTAIYPEPAFNNAMTLLGIKEAEIDPVTQSGSVSIQATPSKSKRVQVGIVSNHAPHSLSSHYQIEAD